jgi:hypothetical protein
MSLRRPPGNPARPFPLSLALAACCLITTVGCRGGCFREQEVTARGVLSRFPAEAQIVVSLDFGRIRATPLWQRLSTLAAEDPNDRKIIDEFTARTGLDPFRQIHRLVAAFPEEARQSRAFGLVIEGDGFDEKRLLTYARDQAKLRGTELRPRTHGQFTLWHSGSADGTAGFFLDRRHFVLASGGWAEKMADLASGAGAAGSAQANPILLRLVERQGVRRSIWMAALVPDGTRATLRADPRFGPQASVMRFGAGLDFGPGLQGQVDAELSNAGDSRAMVDRFDGFLRAARKSPEALLIGAGPYLDGVSARADGPRALLRVQLSEPQTLELANRAAGLLRLRRNQDR